MEGQINVKYGKGRQRSISSEPTPTYYPDIKTAVMESPSSSKIGYCDTNGTVSDSSLHEEIMAGVDDALLRIMSAQRAISTMSLTWEQAEELFSVKLPEGPEPV